MNTFRELRKQISFSFNLDEIQLICFDLNLSFEELPGNRLSVKVSHLILECYLNEKLREFCQILAEERPKVNWPTFEEITQIEWSPILREYKPSLGEGEILQILENAGNNNQLIQGSENIIVGDQSNVTINKTIRVISEDGVKDIDIFKEGKVISNRNDLKGYLEHVTRENKYMRFQGIRSGGRNVHIKLEDFFLKLSVVVGHETRHVSINDMQSLNTYRTSKDSTQTNSFEPKKVTISYALKEHSKLVLLGGPGSGKTTLCRYLALIYSKEVLNLHENQLGKFENEEVSDLKVPIFLELKSIAGHIRSISKSNPIGFSDILEYYDHHLQKQWTQLPENFENLLNLGNVLFIFDGLDEIADPNTQNTLISLIESLSLNFPRCNYLITCRTKAYENRLGFDTGYEIARIQQFSQVDVQNFLIRWFKITTQEVSNDKNSVIASPQRRYEELIEVLEQNSSLKQLSATPLMLTVIALLSLDRIKLPNRRAELYMEAMAIFLERWDESKGIAEPIRINGINLDKHDKVLLLQPVALWMQENKTQLIEAENLRNIISNEIKSNFGTEKRNRTLVDSLIKSLEERAGLLVQEDIGLFAFSHLTFQEYLAAIAILDKEDYIEYSIERIDNPWWREVILLEAGLLSLNGKHRVNKLVSKILDHDNLSSVLLAANACNDIGVGRLSQSIVSRITSKLKNFIDTPLNDPSRKVLVEWLEQKEVVLEALLDLDSGYFSKSTGIPKWIKIPQSIGSGSLSNDVSSKLGPKIVEIPKYYISPTLITNFQYYLFTEETQTKFPMHWGSRKPVDSVMFHPVVNVNYFEALAYCNWLSSKVGKKVALPSEVEWIKAAGWLDNEKILLEYPWGNNFDVLRLNSYYLGLKASTPVGIFKEGKSPYGVFDMSGNVWEWTSTEYEDSLEKPSHENRQLNYYVLKGGGFNFRNDQGYSLTYRSVLGPNDSNFALGFRVTVGIK